MCRSSRIILLISVAFVTLFSTSQKAEDVNDIVYFKLFGKIIGVENIYYYALEKDGSLNAYIRPKFRKDKPFSSFFIGKVKQSELDAWDELVKSEKGKKYKKCGMNIIDIRTSADFHYRVIHDEKDYLTVGSASSKMPDYFIDFLCGFETELKLNTIE